MSDANEMENAESFFDLVRKFSETGVPFSLRALEARAQKLFATHNGTTENPIEIMTIHKAKGLEFDHVILPGLGKSAGSDKKELITWIENGRRHAARPYRGYAEIRETSSLYSYIRRLKAEKLRLEQTRLFYVASTRARLGLHLYGHVKSIRGGRRGGRSKVW